MSIKLLTISRNISIRMAKNKSKSKQTDYEQLGRMLENIYESGYIDRNRAYKMSFLKGIAAGFGGVIGATVFVAILLWTLTLFDQIPLVGPFVQNVQDTIEDKR